MPLIQGKSEKAFTKNLKTEVNEGKPMKQSLAIAYAIKRKNAQKKAYGGEIESLERLPVKAEEHEEIAEPMEHEELPSGPAAEDEPENMKAHGGFILAPHHIAKAIMSKKAELPESQEIPEQENDDAADTFLMEDMPEQEHQESAIPDDEDKASQKKKILSGIMGKLHSRHKV